MTPSASFLFGFLIALFKSTVVLKLETAEIPFLSVVCHKRVRTYLL